MSLKDIELFKEISQSSLNNLEKNIVKKNLKKSELIFLESDDAKFMFIINNGWVKLFRETIDGEEAVTDVLTTGHVFGNDAMFDNYKYNYSAEAVEDATLSLIPLQILSDCLNNDQVLSFNLLKIISTKQKKQRREIEHLTIQTAPQRIGCFLLRLCKAKNQKNLLLHLPYDKSLIASRLGMKAETFSRALSKLKDEVGLKINGSSFMIPDVANLVSFTCNACGDNFPCEDAKV